MAYSPASVVFDFYFLHHHLFAFPPWPSRLNLCARRVPFHLHDTSNTVRIPGVKVHNIVYPVMTNRSGTSVCLSFVRLLCNVMPWKAPFYIRSSCLPPLPLTQLSCLQSSSFHSPPPTSHTADVLYIKPACEHTTPKAPSSSLLYTNYLRCVSPHCLI